MSFLQTFQVFPYVPESLGFLETLSRNLWWCWNIDAIELFRRIDPILWSASGRNPIVFATLIGQERLDELAKDDSFLAHQKRIKDLFETRVIKSVDRPDTLFRKRDTIAYLSMEFGIHESLPLFAGGLGVLAGDHLKAASDNNLPLTGIGLMYRNGYFHQYLNHEGWQQEEYPETDMYHLPVERAKDQQGNDIYISIQGKEGDIHALVWKIMVGRIPLYLLDTNIQKNTPEIRDINSTLYPGEHKNRLAQEVLLGIGGMRVLEALGLNAAVCHMNEGHCAFSSFERLVQTMSKHHVDLKTAVEIVSRTTVFTTHTPVAAGHDEFPVEFVEPYLKPYKDRLGVSVKTLLSWGQPSKDEPDEPISMFVLGLRMAQYCNGVSELHGQVARKMWSHVWPGRPEDEVPITHVTNGVHIPSWISMENAQIFERYLGPTWHLHAWGNDLEERIDKIYDEELWQAHEKSRARLIRSCRKLLSDQYRQRNAPRSVMDQVENVLDHEVLTIAFARRFATYKRANLLLQDIERLEAIINSEKYPVQFIFAGKAHPKDNEGKELIKKVFEFAQRPEVRHRVTFIEDYDISIARQMVQGADVWLNTPRRPFEACGTSGIKAAANGVLNVSTLDGWWCEGYSPEKGWSIGRGKEYRDHDYQDAVESHALYNILENDVIPCFYERKEKNIPERWLKMMKASIKTAIQDFCAHRMVDNYNENYYFPACQRYFELIADNADEAVRLSDLRERLKKNWDGITIDQPERQNAGPFRVGEMFTVAVRVNLGELRPEELDVELYYGKFKSIEAISDGHVETMTMREDLGNGYYLYACSVKCDYSGRFGFTVRVIPKGDDLIQCAPGLISWA